MELIEYPDAEMMMIDLANRLAGQLRQALSARDIVSFAVPGGTTPGPVFDALCAANLDWARVRVLPTDERWVPQTSPRSNARLIREHLLTGRAEAATLIPLSSDAATPEEGLEALTQNLLPVLPLSVALLGMGADMHTASLFPGADQLQAALHGDAPLVAIHAPGAPEPRVTLSARVLNDAMSLHVVITGDDKRAALDRARNLPPEQAPIAAVLSGATVHWAAN
ncbi:MAG: 6-phosphogluconolactonase [Limimaricola sp.]|uniref:6-phosphogluconolactonase n=1 Tax=Limimaricola sp. TaxID=2211665 RepID=UPI001DC11FB2|nr:6-phosphogluconolactonase [Limimaricola sp.]MBI1418227.1 6-phosphogluconolactonase [Limimaricola sp.]